MAAVLSGSGICAVWNGWPVGCTEPETGPAIILPVTLHLVLAILIIAASTAGHFGFAATPDSYPHKRRRPRTDKPGEEEFFLTRSRNSPMMMCFVLLRSTFDSRRHDRARQSAALVRAGRHERSAPPSDSSKNSRIKVRVIARLGVLSGDLADAVRGHP